MRSEVSFSQTRKLPLETAPVMFQLTAVESPTVKVPLLGRDRRRRLGHDGDGAGRAAVPDAPSAL